MKNDEDNVITAKSVNGVLQIDICNVYL